MTRLVAGSLGLALILAGWLTDEARTARLAISIGLPQLALGLTGDPATRGQALLRLGEPEAAATEFQTAGELFNQGVALARAGDYGAALAAWEARLAEAPGDREAEENIALVATLFAGTEFDGSVPFWKRDLEGPTLEAETGQGMGRASSTGDEVTNAQAGFEVPELASHGLRRVPKIFDAQSLAASRGWLDTMADEPGLYLAARIAAERKARIAAGLQLPEPEDPR